jgi:HD-GYP domain-containing protein (c-di-GMP phosphodiesterase class II)
MRDAEPGSFRDVYFRGKKALSREMKRATETGAISNGAVAELARSLFELIADTRAPIATLLALRDRDDFAVVHSVNTGMLAGMQASAMGIEGEEAEAIVFAGLMHDVGKTKVPEAILSKRTALTEKESALLARHTVEGARILFQTGGVDRLAAVAAFEHHSPPPNGEAMLAVELIKIADTFDNIRILRPFDDERSMRGAVAYMYRRIGSRFNIYALERFAALLGLFRSGEHARLSTGEFVRVIDPHPELGFRPKIEVLDRSHGALEHGEVRDFAALEETPSTPRVIPTLPALFADLEPAELDGLG